MSSPNASPERPRISLFTTASVIGGAVAGVLFALAMPHVKDAGIFLPGAVLGTCVALIKGAIDGFLSKRKEGVGKAILVAVLMAPFLAMVGTLLGSMVWPIIELIFWIGGSWMADYKGIVGGLVVGALVGYYPWSFADEKTTPIKGPGVPPDANFIDCGNGQRLVWDDPESYQWELTFKGHAKFWNGVESAIKQFQVWLEALGKRQAWSIVAAIVIPPMALLAAGFFISFVLLFAAFFCMMVGGMVYLYCASMAFLIGEQIAFWVVFIGAPLLVMFITAMALFTYLRKSSDSWFVRITKLLEKNQNRDWSGYWRIGISYLLIMAIGVIAYVFSSPASFLRDGFTGDTASTTQWTLLFLDTLVNAALFNIPQRFFHFSTIQPDRMDAQIATAALRLCLIVGIIRLFWFLSEVWYRDFFSKQPAFYGTTKDLFSFLESRFTFEEKGGLSIRRCRKILVVEHVIEVSRETILSTFSAIARQEELRLENLPAPAPSTQIVAADPLEKDIGLVQPGPKSGQ